MNQEKAVAYKCPICMKRGNDGRMNRQNDSLFLCQKCGSKLTKNQIREKYGKLEELFFADIYIQERNRRFNTDFTKADEGEDPPDVVSHDSKDNELRIEVTRYNPEFWKELGSKGRVSGNVEPLKWLIDSLEVKAKKQYEEQFRK